MSKDKAIDYKKLQEAAKQLNAECDTGIKVIGAKKDDLIKDVVEALEDSSNIAPASVVEFAGEFLSDHITFEVEEGSTSESDETEQEPQVEEVVEDAVEPDEEHPETKTEPTTKLGNTMELLKRYASTLDIEVNDELSLKGLEKHVFDTLDALSHEEWEALPLEIQNWDAAMGKAVEKLKKEKNKKLADSKSKAATKAEKKAKPKSEPRDPSAPRPDFRYTEGTSSAHIMHVFDDLFKKSKGEGLKVTDIVDAAEKAGVKSNNIAKRVATTLRYAKLPEGGSQVYKNGSLWYKSPPEGPPKEESKEE